MKALETDDQFLPILFAVDRFCLMLAWRDYLPDNIKMLKTGYTEITADLIAHLKAESERTGVGIAKLLRGTNDVRPVGLSANIINNWLSGGTTTAKQSHVKWLIERYANYKPPPKHVDQTQEKITITDDRLSQIREEVGRTKLGAINILRLAPKPLPEGLNHQKVQRWIAGDTQTAIKKHWELVLQLYASIGN